MKGALLYGSESWLCDNMHVANGVILNAQKQLLGARAQTCTDLVQLELSSGLAKSLVQKMQINYRHKIDVEAR